jgi:hypothetical protein
MWTWILGWFPTDKADTFGGPHFIALCTGINLVLISWTEFQKKVQYAEHLFAGKLTAAAASNADKQNTQLKKTLCVVMPLIISISKSIWRTTYLLTVALTVAGIGMLYFDAKCRYDYLLLLPTLVYLAWTYFALLIVTIWIWIVQFVLKRIDSPNVEKAVQSFIDKTDKPNE